MLEWLKEQFEALIGFMVDLLMFIPLFVYHAMLGALALVIENIPVPDWIENADGVAAAIPASVAYMFTVFKVQEGVAILMSALVLRFLIRRIPLIG